MGNKKERILIVIPFLSSFIRNDIEILSKNFDVKINHYNYSLKILVPFLLIRQFFFVLLNIYSVDKIVIQFGGYWSVIPSLLGFLFKKPVFIVLHGTDCASIPAIGYGSLRKFLLKQSCRLSYKYSSLLLPVSSSLVLTKSKYYFKNEFSSQGFSHFFPRLETPFQVVPNGIDHLFWKPVKSLEKENNSFIAVFSESQFYLKGGDLILAVAKIFSDSKFYIAGMNRPNGVDLIPKNVIFLGKLDRLKLRSYYNKCQFHFQLSIFEGFGLALCEAMLCGCIPIGSSVNNIPEIIHDTGYVLEKHDENELAKIIEVARVADNKKELILRARERVKENYSLEKREIKLVSIISSYK